MGAPAAIGKSQLAEQKALANTLVELCSAPKRDMGAINNAAKELRATQDRPAQGELSGDWRLTFVSSNDILGAFGTGLHTLPLTRMEDTFVNFKGGRQGRQIETIEVLRVMGPFPNIRNTLSGTYQTIGLDTLSIKYTSMIDGTGKEITSGSAAMDKVSEFGVLFVGADVLVLEPKGIKSAEVPLMVLQKEKDLRDALEKLRV